MSSYVNTILLDHPHAYYRMQEISGNSISEYHNRYTGNIIGGHSLNEQSLINCQGSSVYFDGTNGYSELGPLGDLGSQLDQGFSLSCWVKVTTNGTIQTVVGNYTSGTFIGVFLDFSQSQVLNGHIQLDIGDNGTGRLIAEVRQNTGITDGAIHHLGVSGDINTNTAIITVDGVTQPITYSVQNSPYILTNFGNMGIGANIFLTTPTNFFEGNIDELAIFNSVLNAADFQRHYAAGLACVPCGQRPFVYPFQQPFLKPFGEYS